MYDVCLHPKKPKQRSVIVGIVQYKFSDSSQTSASVHVLCTASLCDERSVSVQGRENPTSGMITEVCQNKGAQGVLRGMNLGCRRAFQRVHGMVTCHSCCRNGHGREPPTGQGSPPLPLLKLGSDSETGTWYLGNYLT